MRGAIDRCSLDLSDLVVFTEAASGAYIVTPVLAAMAGAKHVFAVTQSTRYGSVDEIREKTFELAALAGVTIVWRLLPRSLPRRSCRPTWSPTAAMFGPSIRT